MIRASLAALAVVCVSLGAHAEEVTASTTAPAPVPGVAGGDRFAAPNGQLGAGLTSSPNQKGRAFAELAFGRAAQSESQGGVDAETHVNTLSVLLGGGYKLTPNLELVAMLPIAWGNYGFSVSGTPVDDQLSQSESGVGVGNLHLGLSYLSFGGPVRFMAGGAVQYGPWYQGYDPGAGVGVTTTHAAYGGQDYGLFRPETLTLATPARVEYEKDQLVLAADGALGLHIPTDGDDVELSIQLAPGAGYYVTPTTQIGLRLPFSWLPTESGDNATFFAMEPYARFDFDRLFLTTRFTLNIDDPYGFSFDSGKFWAIHVGGGGTF